MHLYLAYKGGPLLNLILRFVSHQVVISDMVCCYRDFASCREVLIRVCCLFLARNCFGVVFCDCVALPVLQNGVDLHLRN